MTARWPSRWPRPWYHLKATVFESDDIMLAALSANRLSSMSRSWYHDAVRPFPSKDRKMSVIIVTGTIRDQLLASEGEVEIRDEAGNVIGSFLPPLPDLDLTPEELARELASDRKTYTTAEVLAYVKGLVS
jgi:hypothetical protein